MKNKHLNKALLSTIRQVLLTEWNPIGVTGLPEDEYDDYALGVYGLLARDCNQEEIYSYLLKVEAEYLQMHSSHEKLLHVTKLIHELRRNGRRKY